MRNSSVSKQVLGLAAWLAVTFIAAAVGAIASVNAGSFYTQLVQPAWAPPASVFGPVWTVLYIMMGVAAWLVWRIDGYRAASGALALFLVQLVLNSLWTWLFFVWHLGALALAEILLLWLLIVANLVAFYRLRALAGWLLLPYLLWVSFASVLTCAMWQLNPGTLG
ncbi:MAG: tryptophan-rich sensory protein [Gammaproteobacteria bacterium]|nr:tryptophan-rich sensory protein [Gammaproteobacteria bacterium]